MVDHNQEDLLTRSIKNNSCTMCREVYKLPMCNCKAPGKAGKKESGSDDSQSTPNSNNSEVLDTSSQAAIDALRIEFEKIKTIWIQSEVLSDKKITDDVGLIAFEYDKLSGNITIQCKPNLTTNLTKKEEELVREFLKKVEFAFEQFKNQLAPGVLIHQFTALLKNNGLSIEIHVPNSHYNEFIKYLDNKNLLPTPNPWQKSNKKNVDTEEGYQSVKRPLPSPFGNIKEGPKKI